MHYFGGGKNMYTEERLRSKFNIGTYRYFGEATIDDLLVVLTDGWKVDGDIVIEEP